MGEQSILSRIESEFSHVEAAGSGYVGDINSKASAWLAKIGSDLHAFRMEAKNLPNEAKAALSGIIDAIGRAAETVEGHTFKIDGTKGYRSRKGATGNEGK